MTYKSEKERSIPFTVTKSESLPCLKEEVSR